MTVIIGIDPALGNMGITIFSTAQNEIIYNETLSFSKSLSKLSVKDKVLFKNINPSKTDKAQLKQMWTNIRLYEINKHLQRLKEQFGYDVVVIEGQFHRSLSDVAAILRLACVSETRILKNTNYQPKSWRKKLFGSGDIGATEKEIKQFTKDKVEVFLKANKIDFNIKQFNSQDEIDSFALIMTYLYENKLIDVKTKELLKWTVPQIQ